jgi:beta-galactosidase
MQQTAPFQPRRLWHGGDYNPEQWPDRVCAEDIELMAKAGVNAVTLGVFSWAAYEPRPGVFAWEWLDRAFERAHAAGIDVILATPSSAPPRWLACAEPEIMLAEADGRRRQPGWRQQFCPTSPVYRREVRRINTELSRRYGAHPALKLWHISNEYGRCCWCEACVARFREWLRARYGDLDRLNAAWWTKFWGNHYSSWEEIMAPRPYLHPNGPSALQLDWKRFQSDQVVDFCREEIEAVRVHSPSVPVTTNLMGFWDKLDYTRIADLCDVVSHDHYPPLGGDPAREAVALSLVRGLRHGANWLVMEQTPSATSWTNTHRLQPPGHLRRQVWTTLAHGADSALYFQWRRSRGDCEKFHGAVVEHAGSTDARVFREVAQIGEELARLSPMLIGTSVPRARIGVLHDWDNRWAQECGNTPGRPPLYVEAVTKHFKALWRRNVAVDVVRLDADWSGYDLLVGPQLYQLATGAFPLGDWPGPARSRSNVAEKIKAFIEGGGAFVLTHLSGIVDENDLVFEGGYPGPLRETFGVWVEEFEVAPPEVLRNTVLPTDAASGFEGGPHACGRHCDRLRPEGAEVLATYGEGWYAGEPCLTRRRHGRGEAFYLGTDLDDGGLEAFYRGLLAARGHEPVAPAQEKIEFRERAAPDGRRLIIVLNHDFGPREVRLGSLCGRELLSGRAVSETLNLPAHGVALLQL